MAGKRIRVEKAIIYNHENVIFVRFLSGSHVVASDVPFIIEAVANFENYPRQGLLLDVRELEDISNDARKMFAAEKGKFIVANALLINSAIQQTLANLYFRFAHPVIETRMFTEENDAIDWLQAKINS